MPKLIVFLLMPFTWLYAAAIAMRNWLYKKGIYTRTKFDFPVICVGNLTAGGTGKTPHIEWLIQQIYPIYEPAVLSRGYKRKTIGYRLAGIDSTPESLGDEPFQIHQKFPQISVAVCESRVLGIPALLGDSPNTQVVLMDDGFQHLAVEAGLYILLCNYHRPYFNDFMFPSGLLRESSKAASRAHVIVVTKCPPNLTELQKQNIIQQLNPLPFQQVFFTCFEYGNFVPITQAASQLALPHHETVIGMAGIAKADLFLDEVKQHFPKCEALTFSDHQPYDTNTLQTLATTYRNANAKGIITTEKDAVKLMSNEVLPHVNDLPIWYLPIEVKVLFNEEEQFKNVVLNYIHHELEAAQHEA